MRRIRNFRKGPPDQPLRTGNRILRVFGRALKRLASDLHRAVREIPDDRRKKS